MKRKRERGKRKGINRKKEPLLFLWSSSHLNMNKCEEEKRKEKKKKEERRIERRRPSNFLVKTSHFLVLSFFLSFLFLLFFLFHSLLDRICDRRIVTTCIDCSCKVREQNVSKEEEKERRERMNWERQKRKKKETS